MSGAALPGQVPEVFLDLSPGMSSSETVCTWPPGPTVILPASYKASQPNVQASVATWRRSRRSSSLQIERFLLCAATRKPVGYSWPQNACGGLCRRCACGRPGGPGRAGDRHEGWRP